MVTMRAASRDQRQRSVSFWAEIETSRSASGSRRSPRRKGPSRLTEIGSAPPVIGVSASVTAITPALDPALCAAAVCWSRLRRERGARWTAEPLAPAAGDHGNGDEGNPPRALRNAPCTLTSVPNIALAWMARTRAVAVAACAVLLSRPRKRRWRPWWRCSGQAGMCTSSTIGSGPARHSYGCGRERTGAVGHRDLP